MKRFCIAFTCGVLMTAVLFASCTKKSDLAAPYNEALTKTKPPKEFKSCDIKRVICWNPGGLIEHVFEYNQKGDPIRINSLNGGPEYPNFEFRYDNKGRLSDYIAPYPYSGCEFWHVYEYDDKDRMVKDTRYVFSNYGENPTPGWLPLMRITTFEYTDNSTIVKATTVFPYDTRPPYVTSFDYSGNTTIGYENTVNVHRTSWVWMTITHDYAPRNWYPATEYNEYGLPTKYGGYVGPSGQYGAHILDLNYAQKIEYTCKKDQEQ